MHHPPNCLYQVLLVRVYTDLQAPSTHSFLRLVLNVFFIQHIFLLLSGPQLPAVLFPSLHKSTTTCTFTHTLTTHSTLFTCCALSGQHQHHLYSHLGTHTSLSTSTDGHIHPLCPLWTTTPTPPLQSPGHSHNTSTDGCTLFTHCAPSGQHHLYSHPGTHTSLYTSPDGCTLFTRCAPSGQHQHHLYSHPGTHTSIHIYRWVYTIHPLCPLWTTPTPPLQSSGHSHKSIHIYRWVYTIHPLCPLWTTPTPPLQSSGHSHKSIHIYRWAKISDIPMLPSSNICSQILRSYLWWSLCILYSHTCQVRVIVGDSGRHCVMQHLSNLKMLINFLC